MSHKFLTFGEFIENIEKSNENAWLFIDNKAEWSRSTEVLVIYDGYGEEEFSDEVDGTPRIAVEKGMEEVVETDDVKDIIHYIKNGGGSLEFDNIIAALRYYNENDAFFDPSTQGTV